MDSYITTYFNFNKYFSTKNIKINSLIWVYDIRDLSLIPKSPFYSKTSCALELNIHRSTVRAYLDKDKVLFNKWIFSSSSKTSWELSKWSIPKKVWEIITGELLGDGHISYYPLKSRMEFTFSSKALCYINYLKFNALAFICTKSNPIPWPNPKISGKEPTQYWFGTKRLIEISQLHDIWYKKVNGKFIKKLPFNIEELLTPIGLAHWIMGDGYFENNTVKICTDKEEVLNLIKILDTKFNIKSGINKRSNPNNSIVWRIRISRLSLEKLKILIIPYMISEMLYKLGIVNK